MVDIRIIHVAVAKPLRQLYDYSLPDHMAAPEPGARVRVPFGRQTLVGMCMKVSPCEESEATKPRKLKALLEVLDKHAILTPELLSLTQWASDYYHFPIGEVVFAALPSLARQGDSLIPSSDPIWTLTPDVDAAPAANATRLRAVLEILQKTGAQAESVLRGLGVQPQTLRNLEAKDWIEKSATVSPKNPVPAITESPLTLTPEQEHVFAAIQPSAFNCYLLNGVTGSGKTEVYLRVIARVLKSSPQKQVLVLVPEIALTPQTLARFQARFQGVDIMHSGLGNRTRTNAWLKCKSGETRILIGTRSAVFTAFKNLALIVVDEEHDGSFKQQEGFRYSARDLAVKRARDLDIPLILGSATPSLESLHNVQQNRYTELKLTIRTTGALPPRIKILDIRGHKLNDGLSDKLIAVMRRHLEAGNQVLLFVNRRGYAPSYLCPGCSWLASCKRCDARLTLHSKPAGLRCHHCDFRAPVPAACPECQRTGLIAVGLGTQRSEDSVKTLFPGVPVIRVDRDTTRNVSRLESQLDQINTAGPAILIGTQMLAKGHHFPSVTLVGIVNIDAGFYSADFRAPEHTAQLVVQVAGRAGRADKPGEVWIQTYSPDNPLLRALIEKGYKGFCDSEIETRRLSALPPFSHIAMLRTDSNNQTLSQSWLADWIQHLTPPQGLEVLGPAPAPLGRKANRYRSQCLLIASKRALLHHYIDTMLANVPKSRAGDIRWSFDVDPYNTY